MAEIDDETKLAAYNSYKRHMRVFGKGKEVLSFAEWEKKFEKK